MLLCNRVAEIELARARYAPNQALVSRRPRDYVSERSGYQLKLSVRTRFGLARDSSKINLDAWILTQIYDFVEIIKETGSFTFGTSSCVSLRNKNKSVVFFFFFFFFECKLIKVYNQLRTKHLLHLKSGTYVKIFSGTVRDREIIARGRKFDKAIVSMV